MYLFGCQEYLRSQRQQARVQQSLGQAADEPPSI